MPTCLVIEDSAVIRTIIVRIVEELGLEAIEVDGATDGVGRCREARPDVVFLDWDLPSMGALDFLRDVGAFEPDHRPEIILCATENDSEQFSLAKAAGAAHHILKPFDKSTIETKLSEIGLVKVSGEKPSLTATIKTAVS